MSIMTIENDRVGSPLIARGPFIKVQSLKWAMSDDRNLSALLNSGSLQVKAPMLIFCIGGQSNSSEGVRTHIWLMLLMYPVHASLALSKILCHLLVSLELTAPRNFNMTTAVPQEYFLAEQRINLMANTAYTASPTFLAAHEWSSDGRADILATTEAINSLDPALTPTLTKICIIGQALDNPHLLKLKNVGNYNDRFFPMSDSKWVVHLGRPKETVFEHDWNLALHNLQALEQRVATSQGANMLIYGPKDSLKDFRTTAPCFLPNVCDDNDPALVAYIPKVDKRYRDDMQELNPWWMLNVMQIVDIKGRKIAAGSPQEIATMCGVRIMVPGLHYSDAMTDTIAVGPAPAPATVANSSGTPATAPNGIDTTTTASTTAVTPADAGTTITPSAPGTVIDSSTAPATAPNGVDVGATIICSTTDTSTTPSMTTVAPGVVANTDMVRLPSDLPSTSAPVTAAPAPLKATVSIETSGGTVKKTSQTVLDEDKETPTGSTATANEDSTDDGGRLKRKIAESVQPKPKKSRYRKWMAKMDDDKMSRLTLQKFDRQSKV
ncbi:hypothetical protein ARMSODRAFT_982625 [Armillaria solidipes]|uniref:Uncharacterized protein n=1 Tax=Armillaria solidipes TaxID=1076256 RepID=A0A2H3AM58_9AGAR|nr:hypothetical protein ARMSODRAFT_982625 [Armillaria solidipes]